MNFESYAASTISKLTNDMYGIENIMYGIENICLVQNVKTSSIADR